MNIKQVKREIKNNKQVKIRRCKCDHREKAVLNMWALNLDLKSGHESIFLTVEVKEFQSREAERLKSLKPMVVGWVEGTVRWMEEDLRVWEDMETWRRSDRYGGGRLWTALNVRRRSLKLMQNLIGSQWRCSRTDVVNGGLLVIIHPAELWVRQGGRWLMLLTESIEYYGGWQPDSLPVRRDRQRNCHWLRTNCFGYCWFCTNEENLSLVTI